MAVWTLGLNHTTAPLDLRGRFAFALDQLAPTLQGLRTNLALNLDQTPEAAILSTCNRTEIYCAADQAATADTLRWLAQTGGVSAAELHAGFRITAGDGVLVLSRDFEGGVQILDSLRYRGVVAVAEGRLAYGHSGAL